RAESPMEHPAQGKRSGTLGSPGLERSRPVRAKALSHAAIIAQDTHIHLIFHIKTTNSAIS
ncbi:hypothetical protein, partial [Prevotellamassilia timonensis]|uniref:hypothetical protein n=1 Tax=Prevotellamassilia timonensis TaxID=1852370 RepID=UPI003079916F